MRLVERVGLALVAPRRAMARADAESGAAGDALTLLLLKLVCLELPSLVAAGWAMLVVGFGPAMTLLGVRLRGVLATDVALILIGGAVVWIAAGRKRSLGRDVDLACVAWIPVLAVDVAASLVATVFSLTVPSWLRWGLWAAAAGWMGLLLGAAVAQARSRGDEPASGGPG